MIQPMLKEFQTPIVADAIKHHSYGLFLDCGLGKTVVSLATAEAWRCFKVIIVTLAPKVKEKDDIPGSWGWWASKYGDKGLTVTRRGKKFRPTASCYLTNYEALYSRKATTGTKRKTVALDEQLSEFLESCKGKPTCIIFDESHRLKESRSICTKAAVQMSKHIGVNPHILLLSGTPFTKGYEDLRSQLGFLGVFISKEDFLKEYCIQQYKLPGVHWTSQPIIDYRNLDKLLKIVHEHGVTMKAKDVVKLPEQIWNTHYIDNRREVLLLTKPKIPMMWFIEENGERSKLGLPLASTDAEPYAKTIDNPWAYNFMAPDDKFVADNAAQVWLRARELASGFQGNAEDFTYFNNKRVDKLQEIMQELLDQSVMHGVDSNTIIFFNFVPEAIAIEKMLKSITSGPNHEQWAIDYYYGQKHSLSNWEAYIKMPDEEKVKHTHNVILANFASGGTGMNWQDYHHCVIYSLPTFNSWDQSLARIYRMGQKSIHVIYDLIIGNNWVEEGMKEAIDKKQDYTNDLFKQEMEKHQYD